MPVPGRGVSELSPKGKDQAQRGGCGSLPGCCSLRHWVLLVAAAVRQASPPLTAVARLGLRRAGLAGLVGSCEPRIGDQGVVGLGHVGHNPVSGLGVPQCGWSGGCGAVGAAVPGIPLVRRADQAMRVTLYRIYAVQSDSHWVPARPGHRSCGPYVRYAEAPAGPAEGWFPAN